MATQIVLKIEGYKTNVAFSVEGKTITVYMATYATALSFNIGAADWEEIKKFVDEKIKDK